VDKNTCYYLLDDKEDKVNCFSISIVIFLMTFLVLFVQKNSNHYIYPLTNTITGVWLWGRLLDDVYLWYQGDIFTAYIFIWQLMFIAAAWEFQLYPILSLSFYRGWLCFLMACEAFILHDTVFCFLPSTFAYTYFWMFAVKDL
jgi:hypothetical protein